jgi:hypothetical protein
MTIFIRHAQMRRHRIFCVFFKIGVCNDVNYFFAAIKGLFFKDLVNKDGCFCHTEIQLTGVHITKFM